MVKSYHPLRFSRANIIPTKHGHSLRTHRYTVKWRRRPYFTSLPRSWHKMIEVLDLSLPRIFNQGSLNKYCCNCYEARLGLIKLQTLERRRAVLGFCFVFNLLKDDIDSEFLLLNLNFNISARFLRHYRPISLNFFGTNYESNFPFCRLCNDFNCSVCNIKSSLICNSLHKNLF